MYSILLSLTIATLFGAGGTVLGWWAWGWGIFFGLIVFMVAWIVIARRISKRLEPALTNLRKLMEAQMFDHAMQSLKDLLPASKWMPMLHGQLTAQMGVLAYQKGDQQQAVKLLEQAPRRAADAQVLLASILYRSGDKAAAFKRLELAALANKKHPLLHNMYAWLLNKEGRIDDAIAALARYTKKNAADEAGKNNLLRLQNKNKMSMKPFGMLWYALQLEQPPREMGQMRQGRKGFRQPKMRKGG